MSTPTFKLTIEDASGAVAVAEGALALVLKLREILRRHAPDVTTDIANLDAEALKTYQADLDEANAWLKAHGFQEVQR